MGLVEFIVAFLARIMEETGGSPTPEWWAGLAESWPELHGTAKWETFYQTFRRIRPALDALIQAEREKAELEKQLADVTHKLHRVAAGLPPTDKPEWPKIEGWKVQRSPDGYFRAHRRIGAKMVSCYLGKRLDLEASRKKLLAKEAAVREAQEREK